MPDVEAMLLVLPRFDLIHGFDLSKVTEEKGISLVRATNQGNVDAHEKFTNVGFDVKGLHSPWKGLVCSEPIFAAHALYARLISSRAKFCGSISESNSIAVLKVRSLLPANQTQTEMVVVFPLSSFRYEARM